MGEQISNGGRLASESGQHRDRPCGIRSRGTDQQTARLEVSRHRLPQAR